MLNNLITRAVADVAQKIAAADADAVAGCEDAATLSSAEWLALGDKSSRLLLAGIVDADSAQALHSIHTRFHGDASLAERFVFLQVMSEGLPRLRAKGF